MWPFKNNDEEAPKMPECIEKRLYAVYEGDYRICRTDENPLLHKDLLKYNTYNMVIPDDWGEEYYIKKGEIYINTNGISHVVPFTAKVKIGD